jgi:hypothetical protein
MAERVGQGTLTDRWEPRPGACPNIRGGITLERDLPAKPSFWLTGWGKAIRWRVVSVQGRYALGSSFIYYIQ